MPLLCLLAQFSIDAVLHMLLRWAQPLTWGCCTRRTWQARWRRRRGCGPGGPLPWEGLRWLPCNQAWRWAVDCGCDGWVLQQCSRACTQLRSGGYAPRLEWHLGRWEFGVPSPKGGAPPPPSPSGTQPAGAGHSIKQCTAPRGKISWTPIAGQLPRYEGRGRKKRASPRLESVDTPGVSLE